MNNKNNSKAVPKIAVRIRESNVYVLFDTIFGIALELFIFLMLICILCNCL